MRELLVVFAEMLLLLVKTSTLPFGFELGLILWLLFVLAGLFLGAAHLSVIDHILLLLLYALSLSFFFHELFLVLPFFYLSAFLALLLVTSDLSDDLVN